MSKNKLQPKELNPRRSDTSTERVVRCKRLSDF